MTPRTITAKEAIAYLIDIVEEHGDIPVIVHREDHDAVESVGRPMVVSVTPSGSIGDFQAYKYELQQDGSTLAALIY